MEQARAALRLADADPARTVTLAADLARAARAQRDPAVGSVAERALGLGTLHTHHLDAAVAHLRTAVDLGLRAGDPALAAEARMTLAFALNRRGRPAQALSEIDTALRHLDGVARARAQAQRGAILHQLGRFGDALAAYQAALPVLRRGGDRAWEQRVLSNRGLLLGHRQQFAAAEADLRAAERLTGELGMDLVAAFVQQNLGCVQALRGDVPAALHHLDLAERRFRGLRSQVGPVLADRGELLLSVRLVAEAREAAGQAVAAFEREGRRIALPEARLLLARAAVLDGEPAQALYHARRAAREFAGQRRTEWAALARFVVLTSRRAAGHPGPRDARLAERGAQELAAAGWPAAALEARLLAADLAAAAGRTRRSRDHLAAAVRAGRRGPATLRARGWYARARLRLDQGNRRGALAAVRAGLRVLDEHRASLGATDLRARTGGHRLELVDLGLRMALDAGRAQEVLAWAEQGRASHLLMPPVRPPDDPVLEAALGQLRTLSLEIDQQRRAGRRPGRLVPRQIALERAVRDHCRRQRAAAGPAPAERLRVAELADRLGDAALLEFVVSDGALYAVSLACGRVRLHRLGPLAPVVELVASVPFALRRLARPPTGRAGHAGAELLVRRAAGRLDELVLRPLEPVLADRPLVLIPTGPLQSLPWSVLPSCTGRPVTVAPSAASWRAAATRQAPPGGRAVVAGHGLPGALAEAVLVADRHGVRPLVGAAATVAAVSAALDGAELAHLATHGRVRADNPLFSCLELADGPLTVYDLERLRRVPRTVVLAACDTGRTVDCAGDEVLGFGATLLAHGAQQVVASVVPVPDAETTPLMTALHDRMLAGRPVAAALAEAQARLRDGGAAAMAAAAGFVCVGASPEPPRAAVPPVAARAAAAPVRPEAAVRSAALAHLAPAGAAPRGAGSDPTPRGVSCEVTVTG